MCEICGQSHGYIVDHKEELTPNNINDVMITMHYRNFQYVCLACHNRKTFKVGTEERYYFDEQGMAQPIPPVITNFS